MKVRDILKRLADEGWQEKARHSGSSHRQFVHPSRPGKVTVNGKPSDEISGFLLNSIFKQAGWK
jgi:predicted RNA binding protein YcfA (HicA-like mRNA interferase family)